MKRLYFLMLCLLAGITTTQAQIGYQISLLNTATGEPRANENITVTATITNSAGQMIYTTNQQARTNDFGVLSLSIGNAGTFENVDFTKLPFYIEVTANGVQVGKSQILCVPVAEYAKRTGELTKDILVGTWVNGFENNINSTEFVSNSDGSYYSYSYKIYNKYLNKLIFHSDGTGSYESSLRMWSVGHHGGELSNNNVTTSNFQYTICGNQVYVYQQLDDIYNSYNRTSDYVFYTNKICTYYSNLGVLMSNDGGFTKSN